MPRFMINRYGLLVGGVIRVLLLRGVVGGIHCQVVSSSWWFHNVLGVLSVWCSFPISHLVLCMLPRVCILVDFFPSGLVWIFSCAFLLHFSWYLLCLLIQVFLLTAWTRTIDNLEKLYLNSDFSFFFIVAKIMNFWMSCDGLVISVSGLCADFFSARCPGIPQKGKEKDNNKSISRLRRYVWTDEPFVL